MSSDSLIAVLIIGFCFLVHYLYVLKVWFAWTEAWETIYNTNSIHLPQKERDTQIPLARVSFVTSSCRLHLFEFGPEHIIKITASPMLCHHFKHLTVLENWKTAFTTRFDNLKNIFHVWAHSSLPRVLWHHGAFMKLSLEVSAPQIKYAGFEILCYFSTDWKNIKIFCFALKFTMIFFF